jgi:glycosyltransferase involved in cell wall biosynthesis
MTLAQLPPRKDDMRVFMLGWEFPPHISGGLGTACFGMTKALDEIGVEVSFVLPTTVPVDATSHVRLRTPRELPGGPSSVDQAAPLPAEERDQPASILHHVTLHQVAAVLQPYGRPATFAQTPEAARTVTRITELMKQQVAAHQGIEPSTQGAAEVVAQAAPTADQNSPQPMATGAHYGGDLMGQVHRYARLALELSRQESFDVIHAHDWMTYPAGLAVAAASRKPLVVHVHSTEFDRSGENVDQRIYDIERTGMHGADEVVCVSYYTRSIVLGRYAVPPDKVEVVYNAVEFPDNALDLKPIRQTDKIVLFLGRLTMQKGPEYFLRAAKKVVERFQDVRFVVAGSGDMTRRMIEEVAALGLGRFVTFTGFLRGRDVDRIFQMADLYVMPSVSEPFGIAPLEALSHNVPVIISKQSGVSEVLTHVLKVDFWDIDEMANKILAVLRHAPLQRTLRQHGQIELRKLSWRDSATRLKCLYEKLAPAAAGA